MDHRAELERIISDVGPENIWRPIYDKENELLADGVGDVREVRPEDLSRVDFTGKTVLDVGCSFGFYTFLIKRQGASRVLGVDIIEQAVAGCQVLREMFGVDGVDFLHADFTSPQVAGPFDIGLLLNFFGKSMVRSGIAGHLASLEKLSSQAMVISARPFYKMKHFEPDREEMLRIYGPDYVRDGRFFLVDFIRDFFRRNWKMSVISPLYEDDGVRRTLLFERNGSVGGV